MLCFIIHSSYPLFMRSAQPISFCSFELCNQAAWKKVISENIQKKCSIVSYVCGRHRKFQIGLGKQCAESETIARHPDSGMIDRSIYRYGNAISLVKQIAG